MNTLTVEPLCLHETTDPGLLALRESADQHVFWKNVLLNRLANGQLTMEQMRLLFSQYYFYSKNFIRLLATMMTKCDNEVLNRNLIHNLWEEAGENDPNKSHPMLFRRFLTYGLGIENIQQSCPAEYTKTFVNHYIKLCMNSSPVACAAVLGFATEGMVPRLYSLFKKGMLELGIHEVNLEFFTVHISCDDGHAAVFEAIVKHYSGREGWLAECKNAIDRAFGLRNVFFDDVAATFLQQPQIP